MFKLDKNISTTTGILIILFFSFLVGGVLVWQLQLLSKQEIKISEIKPSEELEKIIQKDPIIIQEDSITKIGQICILDNGDRFNPECENRRVELNNLYLYPLRHKDEFQGGFFYLYSSPLFKNAYIDSVGGDMLMKGGFIAIEIKKWNKKDWGEKELSLFNNIKNKVITLEKPISVNIKGIIESVELCTQYAPCKYGLIIILDDIVYNE